MGLFINLAELFTEYKDMVKIIEYWASWCTKCKSLSPIIDSIENEFKGKVSVERIELKDDDESMKIEDELDITSLPVVLIKKDDELVRRVDGLFSRASVVKTIADTISGTEG